jgi:N-acetylglutamate synthase-like GNAT family acetyltransferase
VQDLIRRFSAPLPEFYSGVRRGARAQEEDLCRKSSLLLSLESKTASRYYEFNKSMLNAMLDKCRELGIEEVRFTTKPEVMSIGYALYKKMGFEELENNEGTVLMRMKFN